jgi:hypothetical protein
MPYDPVLLERARSLLAGTTDLVEKKMFGGVCFMIRGNMACGLMSDGGFMARVHADDTDGLLGPNVRVMTQANRVMRGFMLVDPEGVANDVQLAAWIDLSRAYVATLPTKVK